MNIIGSVIAGLIIFIALILLLFLYMRKKKGNYEQIIEPDDESYMVFQLPGPHQEDKHEQKNCETCGLSLKYDFENNKYFCDYCDKYE